MLDFMLASAHHLAAFTLFGTVLAQLAIIGSGMEAPVLRRVSRIDIAYGISALLILIFGFSRALFAAKGWDYYAHNVAFWAKIGIFVVIGLISIRPTITFRRWRSATSPIEPAEVVRIRRYFYAQLVLFIALPILAAAMARGFGQL
ncbi:MAG: DUF2214 family protein [Hyphomicrobiales bacterium]|nr:DUF2214 family protein [Hyphomicrobiales bacterium]